MKTSLTFDAPADFSIGRVSLSCASQPVTDWIATPDHRSISLEDVRPGLYVAEIEPAGLRPQSFVFDVQEGQANTVASPLFSELASGGSAAAFSGVEDPGEAMAQLQCADLSRELELSSPQVELVQQEKAAAGAATAKTLSIGIASWDPNAENWRPYEGEASLALEGNGLDLLVARPDQPEAWGVPVMASLALQGVRVERLLVPLYQGGTSIAYRPSLLTTADIAIDVTPIDPRRRALVRALHAGTTDEAEAIRDQVLPAGGAAEFLKGPDEDPWAAMLAALLTIRFPRIFEDRLDWAPELAGRYGWAFDAHVIHARYVLSNASREEESRRKAAKLALTALAAAVEKDSPYFGYTAQLAGEMLSGLSAVQGGEPSLSNRARKLLAEWQKKLPLQRSAGVSFSWQRSDLELRRTKGRIEPYRRTRGNLNRHFSRILFKGRVDLESLTILADLTKPKPPKSLTASFAPDTVTETKAKTNLLPPGPASLNEEHPEPLALSRPVVVSDDPNKNRFGGSPTRDGYSLEVRFHPTPSTRWAEVELIVRSDRSLPPSYSDVVEFFLHPTFNPSCIKAVFHGHEAKLSIRSWGGFTVGAWIPRKGIELELDIAKAKDAPDFIRLL